MAEAIVSVAVEQLLLLFKNEANLLRGIHKDFDDIRKELVSIQAFLKDADRKTVANEGVKIWVKDVIEAAFHIEDVIDEYMIFARQQPPDPGCVAPLKKIVHLIKTLIRRHRIASEIKEIKSDVCGIKERSARYGFQIHDSFTKQGSSSIMESQNAEWHDPRFTSLYIEEAELVGFEDPRDELVGRLVQGPIERAVVAVVGMGGLGKTTIAKKAFDNKRVVEHFHCRVWITVSQSYTVKWLLKEMLQKLCKESKQSPPGEIDRMDQESLTNAVRDYLKQKRYVVVFDDIWDAQFWRGVEFALLDNKFGSRIIITTRKMDVARFCERNSSLVHVHELQRLTLEKSQELFYKKTFKSDFNECCQEDLREISSKILTKCNGLPLAIVVIGGLLSSKEKTKMEWERFNQSLSLELENDPELNNITKILGFSYDDLPYFLKPCLLYFAMYPEDYEVKSERLIRQWVAEGFIRFAKEKTLEEVAEAYLRELIDRSLVQVSSLTMDGKVKRCRVHDLLREMILKKSKDLSFCEFVGEDDRPISNGIIRRLSVATSRSCNILEIIESSHVRSLLFFQIGMSEYDEDHFLRRIFTIYRSWKVLDFEDYFPWDTFCRNLGNLIHLKYLCLSAGYNPSLPKSVGKLKNLETLILRTRHIVEFPKEFCQVKTLRHIMAKDEVGYGELRFIEGKDYIGGMTCLQTLRNVRVGRDKELIKELGKLRQMRNLGLTLFGEELGSTLCSSLNVMQHLEKLFIRQPMGVYDGVIDLNSISLSLPKLRKLHLTVNITKLPEWVPKLQTLTKLILQWTRLIEDPAESLQNMPNLLYLQITAQGYEGEILHFQDGGFPKLQELVLTYLYDLNSIIIDEGALQSLRKLTLWNLSDLGTAPSGINHLKKLELIRTNLPMQLLPDREHVHPNVVVIIDH